MVYTVQKTRKILETIDELADDISNYFLDTFFSSQPDILSTEEEINFEKVFKDKRKLAPLVTPFAEGKPIYEKSSRTFKFSVLSVKMEDTYDPREALTRRKGKLLTLTPPSPLDNYKAWVAEVALQQYNRVQRRWEWLASKAILDGKITLPATDGYKGQVIDFGRAAGHTITLTGADLWTATTNQITQNIQDWSNLMRQADFGGAPTRITMGSKAYAAFVKDAAIKDRMNTQIINSEMALQRGYLSTDEVQFVGMFDGILPVFVYSDYYHDETGTKVDFMDSRDILLTAGNVDGIKAFGAILDVNADFGAIPFFIRNVVPTEVAGAVPFVYSASAPIMVPMNPNSTLRARVVA